jgi:hypothetical protein
MLWESTEAKLTRGWLRSRTPTQYLTIRARQSPYRLSLAPNADKLRAVNELGTTINYVVALDEDGKLYEGEGLRAESSTNLLPATRVDATRRVRKLLEDNKPQLPFELANSDSDYMLQQRRQMQWILQNRYGLQTAEDLQDNLMNRVLTALGGREGEPALQLPPRSYVAFTETGPEVVLGTSIAEEVASHHVLIGRW